MKLSCVCALPSSTPVVHVQASFSNELLSSCCKPAPEERERLCPGDRNEGQRMLAGPHWGSCVHFTNSRADWYRLGLKSGLMSPPPKLQNKDGRQGVSQRKPWWLFPENRENQKYPHSFPLCDATGDCLADRPEPHGDFAPEKVPVAQSLTIRFVDPKPLLLQQETFGLWEGGLCLPLHRDGLIHKLAFGLINCPQEM